MIGETLFFGGMALVMGLSVLWAVYFMIMGIRNPYPLFHHPLRDWIDSFKIELNCPECDAPSMMVNASRGEDLKIKCRCGYKFIDSVYVKEWTTI